MPLSVSSAKAFRKLSGSIPDSSAKLSTPAQNRPGKGVVCGAVSTSSQANFPLLLRDRNVGSRQTRGSTLRYRAEVLPCAPISRPYIAGIARSDCRHRSALQSRAKPTTHSRRNRDIFPARGMWGTDRSRARADRRWAGIWLCF